MYVVASTASFVNNRIISNIAASPTYSTYGGGIYVKASTVTLDDNYIADNIADNDGGGGVYIDSYSGTVTLSNNLLERNTTYGGGGGVYVDAYSSSIYFHGNTLNNNFGKGGGGATIGANAGSVIFTNNIVYGNTASDLYSSFAGASGGGLSIQARTISLMNNLIYGNTASANNSSGGGLRVVALSGNADILNNTIEGNNARNGGGLYLTLGKEEQGAIASIYNNNFWANAGVEGGDLYVFNGPDGDNFQMPVDLLANNFDQTPGAGYQTTLPITIDPSTNLNKVDPLFVNPANDDFHLQPGSPMIDMGYLTTPNLPDFDLDGNPRVLGSSVDIGAYEFNDDSDPKAILTVGKDGTGSGTIISSPEGINCGSACDYMFDIDSYVALIGTPAANSAFDGWFGDADCEDGQVLMDSNKNCTATFNAVRKLTIKKTGKGIGTVTSTPAGIDCGNSCNAWFYLNDSVQLFATSGTGYKFSSWSGCTSISENICTVTMNAAKSVKATFTALPKYTLKVTKAGTGTVTSTPSGISCGKDCSESYAQDTNVTLTAEPGTGYKFSSWSGCTSTSGNTCTVTMSGAKSVKATFIR